MKVSIQKVLVPLPLREYAEAYKDAGDPVVQVWVNIPREMLKQRDELDQEYTKLYFQAQTLPGMVKPLLAKAKNDKERERIINGNEAAQKEVQQKLEDYKLRSHAWFSELWSQGPEDTRWPVEDILALEEQDHMLLGWMADRTRELLKTRRLDQKNA